jgi:hypothetical protein
MKNMNFDLLKFDLLIISLLFFFDAVGLVGLGVHVQYGSAGRVSHFTEALVPGHGGGGRATEKTIKCILNLLRCNSILILIKHFKGKKRHRYGCGMEHWQHI